MFIQISFFCFNGFYAHPDQEGYPSVWFFKVFGLGFAGCADH
jgi:hypothetical protein